MKYFISSFLIFIMIVGIIIFYAFLIEPKRIVVKTHDLSQTKNALETVKIVQFSDTHISSSFPLKQLEKVVQEINKQKPDIIVFTGDLFDNYATYSYEEEVTEILGQLKAPLGKYAVWGNHDYGGGAVRVYPAIMKNSGFHLLANEGINLTTQKNHKLFIGGVDDYLMGTTLLTETLNNQNENDYSFLLAHEPDIVNYLKDQNVQLILSGHSHGGQIRLPFVTVKNDMAENYTRGFYSLSQDRKLFVHTGLGTTKIPARFGVTPEITVFNLYLS